MHGMSLNAFMSRCQGWVHTQSGPRRILLGFGRSCAAGFCIWSSGDVLAFWRWSREDSQNAGIVRGLASFERWKLSQGQWGCPRPPLAYNLGSGLVQRGVWSSRFPETQPRFAFVFQKADGWRWVQKIGGTNAQQAGVPCAEGQKAAGDLVGRLRWWHRGFSTSPSRTSGAQVRVHGHLAGQRPSSGWRAGWRKLSDVDSAMLESWLEHLQERDQSGQARGISACRLDSENIFL